MSSRVLGGQRTKPRAVWAGEICDLWRAQSGTRAESPDREDEGILGRKSRTFWKLRAGNPGREEWGTLGTKSRESWGERSSQHSEYRRIGISRSKRKNCPRQKEESRDINQRKVSGSDSDLGR